MCPEAHPSRLVSSDRLILNDDFSPLALLSSLDARLGRCTAMAEPIRLVTGFDDMAVIHSAVVIFASPNTLAHSPKVRFVVMITLVCS